jgi:hypothetical protein
MDRPANLAGRRARLAVRADLRRLAVRQRQAAVQAVRQLQGKVRPPALVRPAAAVVRLPRLLRLLVIHRRLRPAAVRRLLLLRRLTLAPSERRLLPLVRVFLP